MRYYKFPIPTLKDKIINFIKYVFFGLMCLYTAYMLFFFIVILAVAIGIPL